MFLRGTVSFCASTSEVHKDPTFADDATRFELFLLGDGEKKITETPFPRKLGPRLGDANVVLLESTRRILTGEFKACPIAPTSL